MKKFIFIGVFLGLVVGILMRPTVPLINEKLPISAVITRGASLEKGDLILKPMAEKGFNTMIIAGLIGGGAGYVLTKVKKQ